MEGNVAYHRLQEIEKRVIACIEVAAEVTEEIARLPALGTSGSQGDTAAAFHSINEKCAKYLQLMEEAHLHVQEGVANFRGINGYELHSYLMMARGYLSGEKVDVISKYLEDLSKILRKEPEGSRDA